MSILKTTLVTTALVFGSTAPVFAQSGLLDKAKDVVADKGVDMAKEKAAGMLGGDAAKLIDPAPKASAQDSVLGAVTSSGGNSVTKGIGGLGGLGSVPSLGGVTDTSLSSGESITAGKVLLKGGSKEDAAMAVLKDRVKGKVKDLGSSTVYGATETTVPTTTTAQVVAAPSSPAAVAVNCPSGTTAQPNGTCLITGDF